jgi:DNA-binding transcriptional MerR regulator
MREHFKTREVAQQLGYRTSRIHLLIQDNLITPPVKDEYGNYRWFPADVERARAALAIDRRTKAYRDSVKAAAS